MSPLYAHCAHCGFPAVVSGLHRSLPRRCRQCGEGFIPEPPDAEIGQTQRVYFTSAERRDALRTKIRRNRRSAV